MAKGTNDKKNRIHNNKTENKTLLTRWFGRRHRPESGALPIAIAAAGAAGTTAAKKTNGSDDHAPTTRTLPTTARKVYVPRYAERDMIMSMPITDRPDLIARANARRLDDVCSDIGFSTASPYSSSSSGRIFPTHSVTVSTAQSSLGGSRRVSPAVSVSEGRLGRGAAGPSDNPSRQHYWNGFGTQQQTSRRTAAVPMCGASLAQTGQRSQLDSLNDALRALESPGTGPRFSLHSPGAAAVYNYAPPRSIRTERGCRPAYFSHHTLPDLRAAEGKGKSKEKPSPYAYLGEVRNPVLSRLRHEHFLDPDDEAGASYAIPRNANAQSVKSGSNGGGGGALGLQGQCDDDKTLTWRTGPRTDEYRLRPPKEQTRAMKNASSNASIIESTTSEAATVATHTSKPSISSASTTLTEPSLARPGDERKDSSHRAEQSKDAGDAGDAGSGPIISTMAATAETTLAKPRLDMSTLSSLT